MANKPALIVTDLGGENSKDLHKARARVLKGGSWKKQRVIVILPSADLIAAKVALSHWNLAFPPNNGVLRILAQGMEVGDAYSSAIEGILANPELSQWEYILTIESDNCPPSDGVVKLIERMEEHPELSCIGGLYFCKGPEGGKAPHIWGDIKDPVLNYRPQPPDANGGLVECVGTSMGFNLWRLSMFRDERLKRPFFRTLNGSNGQGIGTQDLTFWSDARKYGYRCGVDCSVRVGHYDYEGKFGPADFTW
jgi:hypothetical protein